MKQLLIFVVFLLTNNFVLSQEVKTDSILTKKQNLEWLLEFKKIKSTKDKLEAIKKKVFTDRVYNVSEKSCFNLVDYDSPYYREKQLLYECKIAFALKIRKDYYLLDLLNNSKSLELLNQVTTACIENIEILDGKTGKAIAFAYFGTSSCGIAIINSDSKKLKRKIKKVL